METLEQNPIESLELTVEVKGEVVASNAEIFAAELSVALDNINRDLSTPEQFGQAELDARALKAVEAKLADAKKKALDDSASIRDLFTILDNAGETVREVRLELENTIKRRKLEIRAEIIKEGVASIPVRDATLRGKRYRARVEEAAKGKRTEESLRKAVEAEVEAIAGEIEQCRAMLDEVEAIDGADLIPDREQLETMAPDAMQAEISKRRVMREERVRREKVEAELAAAKAEAASKAKAEAEAKEQVSKPEPAATPEPESDDTPTQPYVDPTGEFAQPMSAADQIRKFCNAAREAFTTLKAARECVTDPVALGKVDAFRAAVNSAWGDLIK